MVYIEYFVLHINMRRQSAKFRNTKSRFQQKHNLIIILAVNLILFHKGKQAFFLLWCKDNFLLRIIFQNIT